jgi:hypothetical protein
MITDDFESSVLQLRRFFARQTEVVENCKESCNDQYVRTLRFVDDDDDDDEAKKGSCQNF